MRHSPVCLVELVLELYPVETESVEETFEYVHTEDNTKRHRRENCKT